MGAREYDPSLGRWLSADTIVPDLANSQSLNRFAYVYNNPLKYTDPSGHCAPEDEACNEWADKIEEEWQNVTIIRCVDDWHGACIHWTADEMEMLHETLSEHVYADELDIPIFFVRVDTGKGWAGLHTPMEDKHGNKLSVIRISDKAWRCPPALGLYDTYDLFAKRDYFQGTIAHELVHSAAWAHPEIVDRWMAVEKPWWMGAAVGTWYRWGRYRGIKQEYGDEAYQRLREEELLAMTVAALMYDPWWNQGRQ
jgi:hypothetical protein